MMSSSCWSRASCSVPSCSSDGKVMSSEVSIWVSSLLGCEWRVTIVPSSSELVSFVDNLCNSSLYCTSSSLESCQISHDLIDELVDFEHLCAELIHNTAYLVLMQTATWKPGYMLASFAGPTFSVLCHRSIRKNTGGIGETKKERRKGLSENERGLSLAGRGLVGQ